MGPRFTMILCGIILLFAILYLMLKKKSNESNSLIWIFAAVIIIIMGIFPQILDFVAALLGVVYQPMLAVVVAILFLFAFVFYLSSELSVAQAKISELSIHISLLNNDIVEAKEREKENGLGDETDNGMDEVQ